MSLEATHLEELEALSNRTDEQQSSIHPFIEHLASVFLAYQSNSHSLVISKYSGPSDWRTDLIEHNLESLLRKRDRTEELSTARVLPTGSCLVSTARREGDNAIKDNMNAAEELAALRTQVQEVTRVGKNVTRGELGITLSINAHDPVMSDLQDSVNEMVQTLGTVVKGINHIAGDVGPDGTPTERADVEGMRGAWADMIVRVKGMADDFKSKERMIYHIKHISKAMTAGDLTPRIELDAQGELLDFKRVVNTMLDQVALVTTEVFRVIREVSLEGRLGVMMGVEGKKGIWLDLTVTTNKMSYYLTAHYRAIAQISRRLMKGDFTKKLEEPTPGEIFSTVREFNMLIDVLRTVDEDVARVAPAFDRQQVRQEGQANDAGLELPWARMFPMVNRMVDHFRPWRYP